VIKFKRVIITILVSLIGFTNSNAEIKDGIFITVGNRAITKSDVVNEIKVILILNNMSYSDDKREELQKSAVKSIIERTTKSIEIDKNDSLEFNQNDLNNELKRLANRIDIDVETLKNICISNGLDFSIVMNQIKTELLWNSLIFHLYRNRISINQTEIEEQLKLSKNKKNFEEYLISEIVIKPVREDKLESKIAEIKNKIKIEGFESVAMNLSISQSALKGGDLGWVKENEISKKFKSEIINTPVGNLSEPIFLKEGILIYKVRDKRKMKYKINLEELKEQLIRSEKTKILKMYSLSYYENLRRSVSVKFFDE
jgi:peptidyl-prolyl cis-trans isomerase SurA